MEELIKNKSSNNERSITLEDIFGMASIFQLFPLTRMYIRMGHKNDIVHCESRESRNTGICYYNQN